MPPYAERSGVTTVALVERVRHRHICACGATWTHRYNTCSAHICPRCGEDVETVAIDHRRTARRATAGNFYPPAGSFA